MNHSSLFEAVFSASPSPQILVQADSPGFTITYVNDAFIKRTGRSREQIVGHTLFELYRLIRKNEVSDWQDQLERSLENVIQTGQPDKTPIQLNLIPDGNPTHQHTYWQPVNSPISSEGNGIRWILHTVTEIGAPLKDRDRNEVLSQLHEKEQLLEKTYQLARIGTWEYDLETQELEWSPITKEVHGFGRDYDPDLKSTINLFKEGINRDTFAQTVKNAIEHGKPFDVELKIVSGEGDERWIRAIGDAEYRDGKPVRFYGVSQNIHERKQAEEDLRLREQRFKTLVQDGSDLIAILDSEGAYTYVSPTSMNVLGIPAEEFLGKTPFHYIHPDDSERITILIQNIKPEEQMQVPPFRFRNSDGEWRWIETVMTNRLDDPAVCGLVANSRDITDQINREKELRHSVETLLKFRKIIENSRDGIGIISTPDNTLYMNEALKDQLGYSEEEILGQGGLFTLYNDETLREKVSKTLQKGRYWQGDITVCNHNGEAIDFYLSAGPVFNENRELVAIFGIYTDITERKMQEMQILNSLREKETLLTEIHHRVKNNLAVVSSMMQLQAIEDEDQRVTEKLLDSVSRIKTMANIHEQLYQASDFSSLAFSKNLQTLISNILQTFQPQTDIELKLDCKPVKLNINQAIPCSLIVNEITTNILKHAFPNRKTGTIHLHLSEMRVKNSILLKISDDGIGLPEEFSIPSHSSLGLNLIRVLSEQLNADYRYDSDEKGTTFTLQFTKSGRRGSGNLFLG
ncbi:MAG: PAS domain S-box protein [Balneolaceae bacterium]